MRIDHVLPDGVPLALFYPRFHSGRLSWFTLIPALDSSRPESLLPRLMKLTPDLVLPQFALTLAGRNSVFPTLCRSSFPRRTATTPEIPADPGWAAAHVFAAAQPDRPWVFP